MRTVAAAAAKLLAGGVTIVPVIGTKIAAAQARAPSDGYVLPSILLVTSSKGIRDHDTQPFFELVHSRRYELAKDIAVATVDDSNAETPSPSESFEKMLVPTTATPPVVISPSRMALRRNEGSKATLRPWSHSDDVLARGVAVGMGTCSVRLTTDLALSVHEKIFSSTKELLVDERCKSSKQPKRTVRWGVPQQIIIMA